MSRTDYVSQFHDKLANAMAPRVGQTLTNRDIQKILLDRYPTLKKDAEWIQPSDHCRNHTCKDACRCTTTDDAIFDRVGRGKYFVL